MKQKRTGFTVAVLCLAMINIGCATSPPASERGVGNHEFVPCQEPRPEFCTMHYEPVCGVMAGGESKTYSNACGACSDREIKGYIEGACAADDR